MSEVDALLNRSTNKPRTDEEQYEEYEEFEDYEFKLDPRIKYSLYVLGVFITAAVLYFFTVFLPNYFIPEAVELVDINKVQECSVHLVPLVSEEGLEHDELDEEEEDDDDDDDEIESLDLDVASDFGDADASLADSLMSKYNRMIMIGDIHGHYKQFRKLLRKVGYNSKTDYLLVLGDFITKGPDSFKVLDYLVKNNIDCILGNHEYYVMRYYAQFHGLRFPEFIVDDSTKTRELVPQVSISASFNDDPEFLLAKKLEPSHIKYINSCPLIRKLADVPVYSKKAGKNILTGVGSKHAIPGVAVHGGLRWDLSLEDQPSVDVLEMRSLVGPFFNQSTDDPRTPNAVSWSKIWNQHQKSLDLDQTCSVYYGHDARRGLTIKKFSKGLDSGCDRGQQLSAIVIWDEQVKNSIVHKEKVVQVDC